MAFTWVESFSVARKKYELLIEVRSGLEAENDMMGTWTFSPRSVTKLARIYVVGHKIGCTSIIFFLSSQGLCFERAHEKLRTSIHWHNQWRLMGKQMTVLMKCLRKLQKTRKLCCCLLNVFRQWRSLLKTKILGINHWSYLIYCYAMFLNFELSLFPSKTLTLFKEYSEINNINSSTKFFFTSVLHALVFCN